MINMRKDKYIRNVSNNDKDQRKVYFWSHTLLNLLYDANLKKYRNRGFNSF